MEPRLANDQVAVAVADALRETHPDVEVWDVQVVPAQGLLRVLVDRDGGVDLACCEQVSRALVPFRERYALEVSSPGLERPLVRPSHFARFVGRRAKVKLRELVGGRRSLEGLLVAAGDETFTVLVDDVGELDVPYASVQRANLVWNPVIA